MDRAEAIKFKLMPGGHIRAYDSRTMSGISEAHVYPPQVTAPTILTKGDHIKFLIADEAIYKSLNKATKMSDLVYHEHPTKEQLLEYFSQRIRVRKMTPRESMRLMDVDDSDIDKIMNATETVTLKNGTVKTKKAISKTAVYKLAGNSIVVSCLYHIFRTMFIPGQPENEKPKEIKQYTIFDYL